MKCSKCCKNFISANKFIIHLELFHNIRNNFMCPETDCQRSFHRKYVFRKHLNLKHFKESSFTFEANKCIVEETECNEKTNIPSETHEINNINNEEKVDLYKEISSVFSTFKNVLLKAIQKLISILYKKMTIHKTVIQEIIENISDFLGCGVVENLVKAWNLILEKHDIDTSFSNIFSKMIELLRDPLKSVNTEHKREKYFETCKYLIKPVECKIGSSERALCRNEQISLTLKDCFSYCIPLRLTLKSFLELPNVLDKIIEYQNTIVNYNSSTTGCMFNLLHGSLFMNSFKQHMDYINLPLILYFDDFETGNPLGSHAGVFKLGVVYFTIATIPPEFSSKLENIFLALLFRSSDRFQFGNNIIFGQLIDTLNNLEQHGIEINGCDKKIYFKTTLIIGDNLGLHSIMGYKENFSGTYYCRFCLGTKYENQQQVMQNNDRMRQKEDYESHLKNGQFGIKEQCVWHSLNSFHTYENVSCDVMHDLFEGVHRYDMAHIINYFVGHRYFSLEDLNSRIKYFKYSYDENNKPPSIKLTNLNNKYIVMSATEMLILVRNFRFMVGDLVPEEDEVWSFYLLLLEITNILTATSVSILTIELLRELISEHHRQYINLFSDTLKPKHHFLIHYPNIILKIGPPILISSIRYEAKHRDFKLNILHCRKNVSFTLAMRNQLQFCYRLMARKGFHPSVLIGSETKETVQLQHFFSVAFIEINNIRYKKNFVLVYKTSNNIPTFCEIVQVLVNDKNNCIFYCRILQTKSYDLHYRAFTIIYDNEFIFVKLNELYSEIPSTVLTLPNGLLYVSKEY